MIENLVAPSPDRTQASFYRTAAGAEVDLVLDLPGGARSVVEIKRGLAPRTEKGFHQARGDLKPERSFLVYSGEERFARSGGVEAIGLCAGGGACRAGVRCSGC